MYSSRVKEALFNIKLQVRSLDQGRVKLGLIILMKGSSTLNSSFKLWHLKAHNQARQEKYIAVQNLFGVLTQVKHQQFQSIVASAKIKNQAVKRSIKYSIFSNLYIYMLFSH